MALMADPEVTEDLVSVISAGEGAVAWSFGFGGKGWQKQLCIMLPSTVLRVALLAVQMRVADVCAAAVAHCLLPPWCC